MRPSTSHEAQGMMDWHTCCSILGVREDHTAEQLRSAYKQLALRFHPDKNKGDESATKHFQELQHAYSFLTDPVKRKDHHQGEEYEFDSEDDDYFYDDEVMSFFFGPMGRAGSQGPCDCFHCTERKHFREEILKRTCYKCSGRGHWTRKCPKCNIYFCSEACEKAAKHRVPDDCQAIEKVREASFLPELPAAGKKTKAKASKKKTKAKPKQPQPAAPKEKEQPPKEKDAQQPAKEQPKKEPKKDKEPQLTPQQIQQAAEREKAREREREQERLALEQRRREELKRQQEEALLRKEATARSQAENVARQLLSDLGDMFTLEQIIEAVQANGGKGKAARRALLEEREREEQARAEEEERVRQEQIEHYVSQTERQFKDLAPEVLRSQVEEFVDEKATLPKERHAKLEASLMKKLTELNAAAIAKRKREAQRQQKFEQELQRQCESLTSKMRSLYPSIPVDRIKEIVRHNVAHESSVIADLNVLRVEQQEAELKRQLARIASLAQSLHKKYPELTIESLKEIAERNDGDEQRTTAAVQEAHASLLRDKQEAENREKERSLKRAQEEITRRQEEERMRSDPQLHLRMWLRNCGLGPLEYALVDLDQMDSFAELSTWTLEDMQLLNLTDVDRLALYNSVQEKSRAVGGGASGVSAVGGGGNVLFNSDGTSVNPSTMSLVQQNAPANSNYNYNGGSVGSSSRASSAASSTLNTNAASSGDEDSEDEVPKFSRKSPEGKLMRWMASIGLDYLAPKLIDQGIRSKEHLVQLSDADIDKLDLTIAQKDALCRMLAEKRAAKAASASGDVDSDDGGGVGGQGYTQERRPSLDANGVPNFRRPLCKSYLGNSCSSGIKCKFLHSRPCKFTESGRKCPFSEMCPYLHPNDKGYASARERPCRFVAAGQKCHLGDKCQYLHNIHGWRIEADQDDDGSGIPLNMEGAGGSRSNSAENSPDVTPRDDHDFTTTEDGDDNYSQQSNDARRCPACGTTVFEWSSHIGGAQHKERLFGRVKSVLERGLEMKDSTTQMVTESFGSWKGLAKERPDLFYVEQGNIKLRKVANSMHMGNVTTSSIRVSSNNSNNVVVPLQPAAANPTMFAGANGNFNSSAFSAAAAAPFNPGSFSAPQAPVSGGGVGISKRPNGKKKNNTWNNKK